MLDLDHIWLSDKADKITLVNQDLEEQYGYGLPRYEGVSHAGKDQPPFVLITSAHFHRSNSTFGGSRIEQETVEINSKDAEKLSIENGQAIKLSNKHGEVILKAHVTDNVASGVLYSGKGAWCSSSSTGQTVSALIDNCKTDIGDGAAFYDAFVDLSAP
jgi:anaerobic selenocysteine-containing dehydrogenase